jgi:membrane-bound metal-dependent hydrolase YbcI (DUF457 family)
MRGPGQERCQRDAQEIGLGLMLLALHILVDSLTPAEGVRALLAAVTGEPVMQARWS